VYTYYNEEEDIESMPSELSAGLDTQQAVIDDPDNPDDTTDESSEEQRFLELGRKFEIFRGLGNDDNDFKTIVEQIKCAVDHAGTFTTPRFSDYIADQLDIYQGSGDAHDKYNEMYCKYDSYPEAHDINKSFFNIAQRVASALATDMTASAKNDMIGCILTGEDHAVEQYGTKYSDLVAELVESEGEAVPSGAYVTGDAWHVIQYECILAGMSSKAPDSDEDDADDGPECKKILVSGIVASSDPQVTKIRLYRIGGTLTHYALVDTLPNATQTYLDNKPDDEIAGNHVLDSFNNGLPPENPKYLIEGNAMLFVSSGTELHFSEVAKPYAWPETNFLEFGQEITGMGLVQNGVLVFTRYKTYIVTGNNPATLSRFLISGEQGCVNHDTVAFSDNRLYWLSTDGVCTSNGGAITILTQDLLGRFTSEESINADVFDRMYFLAYEDKTLILDSRYGYAIRELDYNGWYGDFKDELYLQKDDKLQLMFSGEPDVMKYTSPIYTEGRLSELKHFKDIYTTFKGDIKFEIVLHGHDAPYQKVVYSNTLDPQHMQRDIKTKGNSDGYGISFNIEGTGEVHEIDFRAVGRGNAK